MMNKKFIMSFTILIVAGLSLLSFIQAEDIEDTQIDDTQAGAIEEMESTDIKGSQLISLDLKGMDIKDVLKILAQKTGMNIVADNDVQGKVVIYLKEVDAMSVLDIIVSTNNLAYDKEDNLIRIMSDKKYERLYGRRFEDKTYTEIVKLTYIKPSDALKFISQMKTSVGKLIADDHSNTVILIDNREDVDKIKQAILEIDVQMVTEVFSLDYAKVDIIKDKLQEMVSPNIGTIKVDERTNKIIVKDVPKRIESIKQVISAFDEKIKEVVIEASIIQVTLSDKYSYGIDWAEVAKIGNVALTGETNLSTGVTGAAPNLVTIATTGGNYTSVVSLLKTYGKTNVLSRPRITVADREEAKILVGSKEVYVTSEVTTSDGTYHTADKVEFVEVGVRLTVSPEINRAGYIKLKVKPEVSTTDATKTVQLLNPDGSTRTIVPYVTTSEAETTVIVKDNTTLIIGGLMETTLVDHQEKVPFLGDIPILGKLFSTSGKTKEKTELVIFLTPHIIEGNETPKEIIKYLNEWEAYENGQKMYNSALGYYKRGQYANAIEEFQKLKELYPESELVKDADYYLNKSKNAVIEKREAQLYNQELIREQQVARNKEFAQNNLHKIEPPVIVSPSITPYEEYSLTVVREINSFAKDDDVGGLKGEVELQFNLSKDGYVTQGPVVLNKPDLKLVRSAMNSVKEAMPFPPFPKTLKKNETEFYAVVKYE